MNQKKRGWESRIRSAEAPLSAFELADFQERFDLFGLNVAREFFTCLVLVWHEQNWINERIRELFNSIRFPTPLSAREFLETYVNFYQAVLGLVRQAAQHEDHERLTGLLKELGSVMLDAGRPHLLNGAEYFDGEIAEFRAGTSEDGDRLNAALDQFPRMIEIMKTDDRPTTTDAVTEMLLLSVLLSAGFCQNRKARNRLIPLYTRT